MDKKKIIYIILGFWALIVFGWVFQSECTINTGKEILLKTIPVDPRDILMGDYVILNYEIGQFPKNLDIHFEKNKKIYVSLELDNDNVAHIKKLSTYKPDNDLYLQGTLQKCNTTIPLLKMGKCISYGIESYYVKENAGKALEKSLRQGALVRVSVDKNGRAKVKGFQE